MALYDIDTKLSDALLEHPSLIPVVNRLGINLGVGDGSIGEACAARDMRPDFFLSLVNTFVDGDYFPTNAADAFSLEATVGYLRKTSMYYRRVQLPNIERHFNSLVGNSGRENNLQLLQKFFYDMRRQLEWCLDEEEATVFVPLEHGVATVNPQAIAEGYAEVEERIHDLLTFFVVHLRGDYDKNLCMAVVSAVFSLERDIRQNNRIRSRILIPLISQHTV